VSDPYLLPSGTLRNRLDVDDPAELSRREDQLTAARQAILVRKGLTPPFDFDALKEIHRYVFQDVYDWAGLPRTCDLRKATYVDSKEIPRQFTPASDIATEAEQLFGELDRRNQLRGLDASEFTNAAAGLFVRINNLHAFREGNGRVQRLFLKELARNAGHELAFEVVTRERMIAVSIAGLDGDVEGAERLFQEISDSRRVEALRKALRFLKDAHSVPWNDLYVATTTAGQRYAGVLVGTADEDYMMRVSEDPQEWIAIGDVRDLPEDRPMSGDEISITAKRF
jgi:cell filamentation protein